MIAGLRSLSRKFPPRYETLKEAQTEKKINVKTGRLAQHYRCNECQSDFPATEVQIDHRIPVVDPTTGFVDFNTYIERLFCDKSNLQCLCRACHLDKTNKEKQSAKLLKVQAAKDSGANVKGPKKARRSK